MKFECPNCNMSKIYKYEFSFLTYLNGGHIHIEPPPCPSCTSALYTAPSWAGSDKRVVASDWDYRRKTRI